MSAALARVLEDEVLQLCERPLDKHTALEKQRLYSRVGQFLLTALDQQQARHWWCRFPTLMTFMMRVLELHPGPESVRLFFERMAQQLALCTKWCVMCALAAGRLTKTDMLLDSVDIYHSALPSVRMELEEEFTQTSVKEFLHKLASLDAERMRTVFTTLPPSVAGSANMQKAAHERYALTLTTTLYEILSNRRLWSDFRILRVVSKWLSTSPAARDAVDVEALRDCQGLYQWLVSPDAGIR
ncbi:hypothetical protein PINS_up006296 [Pythium insidiosum]|nr:hypothetical protein PINS_up006296 [Pythium insidiosum]